jgi:head-tail adaptor
LKGQELFRASDVPQKIAEVEARIRIRYRKGLDPAKHRIVYDGIIYDLVAVIPDRGNDQTQLMVKASAVQQPDGGRVNE